jgi:hypothetical protein
MSSTGCILFYECFAIRYWLALSFGLELKVPVEFRNFCMGDTRDGL